MGTFMQEDDSINILAEERADKPVQTFLNYMGSPTFQILKK